MEAVRDRVAPCRRYEQLPGPRGVPLFGNTLQIDARRMHLQLEHWCHRFGSVYRIRLGSRRVLVVGDHQVIAATLRDRPNGFRRTSRLEEIWTEMGLEPGVFVANGDAWREQRQMVMAAFGPANVKRYFPSLRAAAGRLTARWRRCSERGEVIDLQADLMRYTVDTIAGLAFGAEVNTLDSDCDVIQVQLNKIFPAIFHRTIATFPRWRFLRSQADHDLEHAVAVVKVAVNAFIEDARARLQADSARVEFPQNLLEAMLIAADRRDSVIDDRYIAGNVLTLLLAGEDTTANTIAWLVYLLWRNPRVLARAAEEVRAVVLDSGCPTWNEISQLSYVEACAHEAMRLKPVAPIVSLEAMRESVIGGVRVPVGTVVLNLMRHDCMCPDHVAQPREFVPERWLTTEGAQCNSTPIRRVSMPFGAGPRICPGRYLALLEMKTAIAMLLGKFHISSVVTSTGDEPAERLLFTMAPVGLRMRVQNC